MSSESNVVNRADALPDALAEQLQKSLRLLFKKHRHIRIDKVCAFQNENGVQGVEVQVSNKDDERDYVDLRYKADGGFDGILPRATASIRAHYEVA